MTPGYIFLFAFLFGAGFLIVALMRAPHGWEDWRGFHVGEPDPLPEHPDAQREGAAETPWGTIIDHHGGVIK